MRCGILPSLSLPSAAKSVYTTVKVNTINSTAISVSSLGFEVNSTDDAKWWWLEDLRNEIASKQERERRIIKKVGLPLTGNDDVNFFNIVCRKPGGLKDAKFLTTLANLRMQYFKHLLLLFGSHVEECPLPAGVSGYSLAIGFAVGANVI